VRLLLDRLGITPEEILSITPHARQVPTFDEYIDRVTQAVSDGTRRVYSTYWRKISAAWGSRRLDEPTPLQIAQLAERIKNNATTRRNSRGGRSAAEHFIAALRCLYRHAVADQIITESANPAIRVAKPRRVPTPRRALADNQLADIIHITSTTGNDPELDALIVRLHIETACRRAGALGIRREDLDPQLCLVRLHEKGGTVRWQPVSPSLMQALLRHFHQRGSDNPKEQVLRQRNGQPITRRRYDYLWTRIGHHLPWVAAQQISIHWIRHTTLTWVERRFGYAVARAYAGHNSGRDIGSTATYVQADLNEVAQALAAMAGEPHPCAQ
jgi:integrase